MEEKEVILTKEGYDKLEKELEFLRTEKRTDPEVWTAYLPDQPTFYLQHYEYHQLPCPQRQMQ